MKKKNPRCQVETINNLPLCEYNVHVYYSDTLFSGTCMHLKISIASWAAQWAQSVDLVGAVITLAEEWGSTKLKSKSKKRYLGNEKQLNLNIKNLNHIFSSFF